MVNESGQTPACSGCTAGECWGIRLAYPDAPVVAFHLPSEEIALDRIKRALLTMSPKRIDPRWVDAEPVRRS